MNNESKKRLNARDLPNEFSLYTRDTISRIEENPNVFGVLYYRNGKNEYPELCTLPENMAKTLTTKLPSLSSAVCRAVIDIDVTNEPIAYRIETKRTEIAVVMDKQFIACVVHKPRGKAKAKETVIHTESELEMFSPINKKDRSTMKILTNLLKDSTDEWLLNTTVSLNEINPIVDRIMEDDSVEGVVMTNKEGSPILTNINVMGATNYGAAMQKLGQMAQASVKEIDPFDEVLILRLNTNKLEVMTAHHPEFNIIVLQHAGVTNLKK